jgi:beta-1,4-mannosyltransferase
MKTNKPLKVLFSPAGDNPYQYLLASHLESQGVEVYQEEFLPRKAFNFKFLSQFQILHLHWLQPLYHDEKIVLCLLKSALFYLALMFFTLRKIPIVVTMHNLLPHETKFPAIDRFFRRKINRSAAALLFHSEKARSDFINMFGRAKAKYEVVPHGVYPESLVPLPDRNEAREYLKIPPSVEAVGLFLGRASNQKGYDIILSHMDYFRAKKIHIIFAGSDFSQELLGKFSNATVLPYHVPDDELPVLFAAANSVLLPYRACTTSGLAVLSIGFGVPVVCSDVPYLKEICDQSLGLICDAFDCEDFSRKILLSEGMANQASYKDARLSYLDDHSWEKLAQDIFSIYSLLT